jgi:hypothetical protein
MEREQLTYKRTTYVQVLLVKQWKESYLRKGIVGKTVEREQPTLRYCWQNSGKRTTYVKVLLVKQWK